MSQSAEPVADRILNNASAIGSNNKNGKPDHTEIVNASIKKSLFPVMNADAKMIPATRACIAIPIMVKKKNPSSGVHVISLSNDRNHPVGRRIIYKNSVPNELRKTKSIVEITIATVAELSSPTDNV